MYPFLLRSLAEEPWTDSAETGWDLVGPYGYGGAFAWNVSEEDAADFWNQFEDWCRAQEVVSSFVRLSLFPDQMLPFHDQVEPKQSNVVCDLEPDPDALWRGYEHKVRKNVNRARRAGVTVATDALGRRLEEFLAVYRSTMDRRDADASYFFPREFFEHIVRDLAGQFIFCHAFHEGRMISTELALVSARHVYSFLGGTLPDAFPHRPNDLLKHEIVLWAREAGKRAFVLGGGYQGDDGIFRYKRSFAPSGVVSFSVGKRIHDGAAYARLVDQRRRWQQCGKKPWQPRDGWFPEYRA